MAGNIKGITIEIGGETTKLQKALTDVNKKSKDIQSELKQVEKLLKLDPKNTELLAQRQKLLADAVENSKEKLNRLKIAQAEVNEQFKKGEISEEQYRAFQREVVKAEQELDGFEKKLKDTAAASKSLGEKMKEAGTKMKDVGSTLTKNVTVPLVAAGAGAVAMGKSFDDAYDKIRIGTGATGKALGGLNEDFRKVAKQVPSGFDDISTAIADYNTRLGISGKALQDLSVQTLNLARVTEGDLGKIIEETSQAFQAFKIPAENYGDALDYVFKVSQSTGISIDRLEANLVKFAPALKQMGFDFYDAAALMGFFDKAGVEVEQAMVGLNKALVTMAKAGVTDANDALQMLFDEIKGAPSDIKATELAIEVFGSKAGPLLASAIREGKLGYEELVAELVKSKETINGVAAETDDWAEGLAKLKNQVMIATEPIAGKLFDALNGLTPLLEKAIVPLTKLAEGFGNLPQGAQVAILAFAGLLAALGPLLTIIGSIVIAAPGIGVALAALTGPIGIAIAAIIAIGAALTALWTSNEDFRNAVKKIWSEISQSIKQAIDQITAWWREWGPALTGIVKPMWETVKTIITTVLKVVGEVISLFLNVMTGDWKGAGQDLIDITKTLWDGIKGIAQGIADTFSGIWNLIIRVARDRWNTFKEAVLSPVRALQSALFSIISSIQSAFANMRITIPRPKLPHINVNWKSVGFGDAKVNIPDFDLNWYKMGGIFAQPSIIGVGEAGKEAVIPLDRLPGLIADALREAIGGTLKSSSGGNFDDRPIQLVINLDGRVIAQNLYKRQRDDARGRGIT